MTDRVKRLWHINYVANEHFSCYKQRCTCKQVITCVEQICYDETHHYPLSIFLPYVFHEVSSFTSLSVFVLLPFLDDPRKFLFPFISLESSLASISCQSSEDCCCGNSILVCLYSFLNFFAIEVGDCYLAEGTCFGETNIFAAPLV